MGRPSHRVCAHDTDRFAWGKKNTHTHTHTHTHWKKERKKDRRQKSNRKKINSAIHQRWRWSLTYQMTAGRFSWSCLSFHFQMTIQSTLDSNPPPPHRLSQQHQSWLDHLSRNRPIFLLLPPWPSWPPSLICIMTPIIIKWMQSQVRNCPPICLADSTPPATSFSFPNFQTSTTTNSLKQYDSNIWNK